MDAILLGEVRQRKREARGKSVFQDTMITWGLGEAESAGVENSHGEGKRGIIWKNVGAAS